jgi:hypothetical protein
MQDPIKLEDWQYGAFTKILIEGLDGNADYSHDQVITIGEPKRYLPIKLKEPTGNHQTPQRVIFRSNFPIVRMASTANG